MRDMVAMERLASPQPSPDGSQVVFTRRVYDAEANRNFTSLWIVPIDGGRPRRLTNAPAADTSPRWSPDAKSIAFISDRGGSSQVWSIDPSGGEARRVTDLPVDVDNVQWSPDGTRLAFSAEVYPDCPDLACTAKRDKEKSDNPVKARVYTRLMIRHWDAWDEGKRNHIFVWPLRGGDPVDVMKGADADSPTKPFGGTEEFAWSPDGKSIAFTSKMARNEAWSTDDNIYLANADGGGYRCLTCANEALDAQPAFSPDGKSIAYLAMSRPGYEADRQRVMLYDLPSGKSRSLTESWDRSAGSVVWSPDGKRLFVTAEETARLKIFAVDPAGGRVSVVVGEHENTDVTVTSRGRLVYGQDSLVSPTEIVTCLLDGTDVRVLTRVNAARLETVKLSRPEEFWFKGAMDEKVHGWILKPVDFQEGRRYPLAFLVHGGPQGSWEDHFHYRWNPQAYAGAGYATVTINFHGSTGFGQAFTDAIRRNWGAAPYEDLMKGLDYVLATYDFVDRDRMGALGASYGGYMINWIAGHTDRFKCLVSHDGEFDTRTSYYATEELWFPEWEHGGPPWEPGTTHDVWSPALFVANWKTPMLVIHGAKDYRLPETEGFSVFTALQRRGIPSKLLYFPDENHWVLKAKNSILWHDTVIAWLDRWLKK
ncbi:MAG: peptidase S9 [Acidobacteria bacterium 13_1_40CM_2_68_5]|nr:MAG: peptidase S9 [Acidobacteria bacterium 13_1_40CM_2_68_5]